MLALRDDDTAQVGQRRVVLAEALVAFVVDEGDDCSRVAQPVLELGPRPPRVERNDHCARGRGGPEGDRPLGEVAHRDRDAVALSHAEVVDEAMGERCGRREVVTEGQRVVLVHEEREVAVGPALLEHRPQ